MLLNKIGHLLGGIFFVRYSVEVSVKQSLKVTIRKSDEHFNPNPLSGAIPFRPHFEWAALLSINSPNEIEIYAVFLLHFADFLF